jgi:glycerol-3-phosphate acyltransferase PlsX
VTSEVTGEDVFVAGRSVPGSAGDVSSRRPGGVQSPIRIAVDLLGGDEAPAVVVDGALRALAVDPGLYLLLVGPRGVADSVLRALGPADRERVGVRVADGVVSMADPPSRAADIDTSLRVAAAAHADGEVDAVVSAGSSGAIVTAAVLALGRSEGVRKPALAVWLPTSSGRERLLLDVGGSVESTVSCLVSHTGLGVAYARQSGVVRPKVGLLSVGSEPGKGDRVRRAAERALHHLDGIPMDFVGLVEGGDVCLGERADVVITDGFTGNVLLKGIEGAYRLALGRTAGHPHYESPTRAAALLGVPGIVVVCHGAATAEDLASGVAFAASRARRGPEGEQ